MIMWAKRGNGEHFKAVHKGTEKKYTSKTAELKLLG